MSESLFNEDALGEFSKVFAQALFAAYPDWRKFASVETARSSSERFLLVKVSPPQESRAAHPLHIDTENGEITIGFDFYHAHWEWPSSDDHRNPVRYLSDLLDEKIVVASFWRGDEWKGSTMVDAGVTDIPAVSAAAELLRLRSWRGTFSSDLALSGAAA